MHGARDHRVEILSTILLAVAAIATAWSTFQAGRWRGEQAVDTNRGQAARIESSEAHTRAGQLTQIDIAVFIQWVNAHTAGNVKLAQFYRRRFRAEFQPSFAAWIASRPFTNQNAPTSPFELPEYKLADEQRAKALAAVATVKSAAASSANQHADDYLLALVLFASSLFFAGISTKVRSICQREILLAIGGLMFVGTVAWLATVPVSFTI